MSHLLQEETHYTAGTQLGSFLMKTTAQVDYITIQLHLHLHIAVIKLS